MRLLVRWLINAISLMIVAHFVSGFAVRGFTGALIAAVIIGFVNATFGFVLKVITFPFTILTFGLFLIVINAMMLKVAAALYSGLYVANWRAAFIGAILLTLVSSLLSWMVTEKKRN